MKDVEKLPTTKELPISHQEKRTAWSRLSSVRVIVIGLCLVLYFLYGQRAESGSMRQFEDVLNGMKIANGITRAPGELTLIRRGKS